MALAGSSPSRLSFKTVELRSGTFKTRPSSSTTRTSFECACRISPLSRSEGAATHSTTRCLEVTTDRAMKCCNHNQCRVPTATSITRILPCLSLLTMELKVLHRGLTTLPELGTHLGSIPMTTCTFVLEDTTSHTLCMAPLV